jgi:hypothetical protein
LTEENINQLASKSDELSARDIKEICLHAERKFANYIVTSTKNNTSSDNSNDDDDNDVNDKNLIPSFDYYSEALERRRSTTTHIGNRNNIHHQHPKF